MTPNPTPQHAHDHGAAGFCTDHAQHPDERTETVARVLLEHTRIGIWECACGGFHLYNGEPELRRKRHNEHQAAAVVAALDDESARLREPVRPWCSDPDFDQEFARAMAERDAARAALDRVRAVMDVERGFIWCSDLDPQGVIRLHDLRAALDPEEPR